MKNDFDIESEDSIISEINITPLVDVMLLLMIIFLVTAPLMVNNLSVKLPQAQGSADTKQVNKIISIKESGEIYFENKKVSLDELGLELENYQDKEKLTIKIAASKNCSYQDVVSVLSILSKNKVLNINFLTQN